MQLMMQKYPPQSALPGPMPKFAEVRVFRVTPQVISVLDYSQGFAHTDLVHCQDKDRLSVLVSRNEPVVLRRP